MDARELRGTHSLFSSYFAVELSEPLFFPHHLEAFSVADRSRLLGFHLHSLSPPPYRLRTFH